MRHFRGPQSGLWDASDYSLVRPIPACRSWFPQANVAQVSGFRHARKGTWWWFRAREGSTGQKRTIRTGSNNPTQSDSLPNRLYSVMKTVPQRDSVWLAEGLSFEFLAEPHATALWYCLHDTAARVFTRPLKAIGSLIIDSS